MRMLFRTLRHWSVEYGSDPRAGIADLRLMSGQWAVSGAVITLADNSAAFVPRTRFAGIVAPTRTLVLAAEPAERRSASDPTETGRGTGYWSGLARATQKAGGPRGAVTGLAALLGATSLTDEGQAGHVEDAIVDTATWSVPYLVLGATAWWPHFMLLIATAWIREVRPELHSISLNLSAGEVRNAPRFFGLDQLDAAYEERLFSYYRRERRSSREL